MKICVSVKCPANLREFLIARNKGSDVLKVNYTDAFVRRIIPYLESTPEDIVIPPVVNEDHIMVEISYFKQDGVMQSSEFKNYLSEENQKAIVSEWEDTYKEIFHNYVAGFCKGMNYKIPCQKRAIISFCNDYDIPMNKILFDSLKKSWDRSKQKGKDIMKFKRASFEKNKK